MDDYKEEYDLDLLKIEFRTQTDDTALRMRHSISQGYDSEERYGWAEKGRLAQACLNGDAEAAATLQIECDARGDGLSAQQLAQGILAKAAKFRKAELYIRGVQTRLQKSIEAATTLAELDAIEAELQSAFTLPSA